MLVRKTLRLLRERVEALARHEPFIAETFELAYEEGFPSEEVAYILGVPEAQVRAALEILESDIGTRADWASLLDAQRAADNATVELSRPMSRPLAAAAESVDVNELRALYYEHPIDIGVARVSVTIEPDENTVILHFASDRDFAGTRVRLFRRDDAESPSIDKGIRSGDATFALDELGLEIGGIGQVGFEVAVHDDTIRGSLDPDELPS